MRLAAPETRFLPYPGHDLPVVYEAIARLGPAVVISSRHLDNAGQRPKVFEISIAGENRWEVVHEMALERRETCAEHCDPRFEEAARM